MTSGGWQLCGQCHSFGVSGEFCYESVNLGVGDVYATAFQDFANTFAHVLSLFGGEQQCGTRAYYCSPEEGILKIQSFFIVLRF